MAGHHLNRTREDQLADTEMTCGIAHVVEPPNIGFNELIDEISFIRCCRKMYHRIHALYSIAD